ncbi:MAG: DUF2309 domain-containing protein [Betaproteobacteria bacterium]|nr:DUF2309 domain-containing protein [Betaproteobacteria bacterium]
MHDAVEAACTQACSAIAPAWPLDQAIAVNPHWGRIDRPLREVAARLAVFAGIQVFPSRDYLSQAWNAGRITGDDLRAAMTLLTATGMPMPDLQECIGALHRPQDITRLPLLIDILDEDPLRHTRLSWREAITHQVSQTCAAYFDQDQADWRPDRQGGLYAFWRDTLAHDHGIGVLMGLPDLGKRLAALPANRQAAEQWALERLGLPGPVWADYLEAVLLTVNGWASWCAYLGWQARLEGKTDEHLRELLAVRLAWGAILLECTSGAAARRAFAELQQAWGQAPAVLSKAEDALGVDELWQLALETGYQRELAAQLRSPTAGAAASAAVEVQAAFCIDVRSEPLRRLLEASWPALQTIGCAGFFGLPAAYAPLATDLRRPQLPGLLAPALVIEDRLVEKSAQGAYALQRKQEKARQARQRRFAWARQWRAASRWASGAFPFVEAVGLAYLGKLGGWLKPSGTRRRNDDLAGLPAHYRSVNRPRLYGLDTKTKADLAAGILHALGLDHDIAPLVLLIGHGSQSANNAHAAALDCGACCGQTGEVNARALAALLNEPAVRDGLVARGIPLPAETVFVAGLHNTTTDEVEWFDLDLLPKGAPAQWARVQAVFEEACDRLRRLRAPSLDLNPDEGRTPLLSRLRQRANDGAQTRPEWGLAGNAAFIIAPRRSTRGLSLQGRCFLHDYEAANDPDGSVLELLMTAPMLVTHWINWQYHASTCEPGRLGSGNKLLHNVVGGRIGVFEGNGGDLRIGLSRQSLHDGHRWIHEPLRLTVVIEAPAQSIDRVIERHAVVRNLLRNGWLHLWCLEDGQLSRHVAEGWKPLETMPLVPEGD